MAEEVHCIAENGSARRVDIIAFDKKSMKGYILDPTVFFENGEADLQSTETDLRKTEIYEPCRSYLKTNYNLNEIEVIGLYVGARGTISTFFQEFVNRFSLASSLVNDVMMYALRGSIRIYNHQMKT